MIAGTLPVFGRCFRIAKKMKDKKMERERWNGEREREACADSRDDQVLVVLRDDHIIMFISRYNYLKSLV